MPTKTNTLAYTSPINPPGQTPLSPTQVWHMLAHKVTSAETYVPAALLSTRIISTTAPTPTYPHTVIERAVRFRARPDEEVREVCTLFEPCKVEFLQRDGSKIFNVVSFGGGGEMFLTYVFEWVHEEGEAEGKREGEERMARGAVEGTLVAMRRLVGEGRF